jgi:7,8-dihydropterin-6-yl-methyl-4-(beta-D-ribofuranosyl)aminobenzene 5'-phosphate synthase
MFAEITPAGQRVAPRFPQLVQDRRRRTAHNARAVERIPRSPTSVAPVEINAAATETCDFCFPFGPDRNSHMSKLQPTSSVAQRKPSPPLDAGDKIDFGACRSMKITCVSEIGWLNGAKLMQEVGAAGGPGVSQWRIPWDDENARGSCSLLEIETLDHARRRILIDAGWNRDYMRARFAATGVDRMLENGEIEAVLFTHEHMDHLFGLQAVLERRPDIRIYIPSTFHAEAERFIASAEFPDAHAGNGVAHTGELIRLDPGGAHVLMPGLAAVVFELPIMLAVSGEMSLYANVADKGLVAITGCGHHTLERITAFAAENLTEGSRLYGLYGGLHLAPFGTLAPPQEAVVRGMGKYGFRRIACNHCTGLAAVELMVELGYPVVRGRGADGSVSDLYVGNGDCVTFD